MSFMRKFQDVVSKAQEQAAVQGGNLSRQMGTGSQQLTSNFTLEKECVCCSSLNATVAAVLWSLLLLIDPLHTRTQMPTSCCDSRE